MKPVLMKLTEAAERSGYHAVHLRRLMRARLVNGRRIGWVWYVDINSLEYYAKFVGKGHREKQDGRAQGAERAPTRTT